MDYKEDEIFRRLKRSPYEVLVTIRNYILLSAKWLLLKNITGHLVNIKKNDGKEMSSEDDTFEALKRTPFEEMWKIMGEKSYDDPESLLRLHGWDPKEFWSKVRWKSL
jgi:hypothetical protein